MLDNDLLHQSPVVANCLMNRERQLTGSNGYGRELRFEIDQWLQSLGHSSHARWLDVCCGSGIALVEAAELMKKQRSEKLLAIEGIDLAGHFVHHSNEPLLKFQKTSVEAWTSEFEYDLITCVHGLHYIGDKLSAICKLLSCLTIRGRFYANIDLANLVFADGRAAGRTIIKRLRERGIEYDSRSRLLKCIGKKSLDGLEFEYVGADDQAGPNYTGQPAVNSCYRVARS